jgi:hypothetical protein
MPSGQVDSYTLPYVRVAWLSDCTIGRANLGVASLPEKFGSLGNVRHRIRNDEYH